MQNTNEMTKANETTTNLKENEMSDAINDMGFSINPNDYGFKFATKDGEFNTNFHIDDDDNWGITFTSPNNADARLDFEGGEGTISYADADGKQSEKFNFTSARKWLERFGITTTDEADAE